MPMRLGITGAAGFLGWHLRAHVYASKEIEVSLAERKTFERDAALDEFVRQSDVIAHLAGMNRGLDTDVERINIELAESLIAACERTGRNPHVIFANSTHYNRETAYARSKRRCVELLGAWAAGKRAKFTNLVMPGIFGERGRPFYNSVTSTFCHQLARGEAPRIIDDVEIEVVHAQEVARRVMEIASRGEEGEVRISGRQITVSTLLAKLRSIAEQYQSNLFPSLADPFDLALFNTYRCYLFPQHYPVALALHSDQRGSLFEAVKTAHGGQCFISTTRPGVTRGQHYHRAKIERFLVVQGTARIRVRALFTEETAVFVVSGEAPAYIDMPAFHTHDITNIGTGEVLTLFWAHEVFDPAKPDTYSEPV